MEARGIKFVKYVCFLQIKNINSLGTKEKKWRKKKRKTLWELFNKRCLSFVIICVWCSFTTEILNLANKLKQRLANSFNYLLRIFFWKVFFGDVLSEGILTKGYFHWVQLEGSLFQRTVLKTIWVVILSIW